MKKKWWIMIVAVILVVGAYLGYGAYQQGSAQATNGEEEIETAVVERGALSVTIDAGGSVYANREVSLAFSGSGVVTEVFVEKGAVVSKGDTLARLDDADAQQAVTEAEIQVREAEFSLESLKTEIENGVAEADLAAAQASYDSKAVQLAYTGDQLTSVRIQLEQAQRSLEDAQETYREAWDPARDWELQVARMASRLESDRESAEDNLEKAQEDLEIAQANYNLQVIGIDDSSAKSAQVQLLNAQIAVAELPIQLEQAELALKQAELKLESAQRALEDTVLTAVIDGTVTELNIQVGEMSSQPAVVLSDLATMIVEVGLDESDVAQVSMGQSVIVTLDAFDEAEFSGQVTYIAPVASTQSGVVLYPVEITLDPTELPVRVGMTADVEIVTASAENVLYIPLKAVRSMNGQSFVLRQIREGEDVSSLGFGAMNGGQRPGAENTPGTTAGMDGANAMGQRARQMSDTMSQITESGFVPVVVELGVTTDAYVEVISGLEEGDIINVSSTTTVSSEANPEGAPPMGGMGMGMGMMGGGRP